MCFRYHMAGGPIRYRRMPIIQINAQFVYYAHVPKCVGSAVEDYLIQWFGSLAFLNRKFGHVPRKSSWSLSSPQHIDRQTLSTLFPDRFFHVSFAVVRHPESRMLSADTFQEKVNLLSPGTTFKTWMLPIAAWRDNYNYHRPHTSLDGLTPGEYHRRSEEDQTLNRAHL